MAVPPADRQLGREGGRDVSHESASDSVEFRLNGVGVSTPGVGSLLDALREHLNVRSVKDGCSPQGQCGCCTVWVDGQPRVACVTPVARVAHREVTTLEGLSDANRWATAFVQSGASQCGFCTPGIIMRCAALADRSVANAQKALLAHLCRCTGWQPIVEAVAGFNSGEHELSAVTVSAELGAQRAFLEGGARQAVGVEVALGNGGFADDTAPSDALVAVRDARGEYLVGETLSEARALSGKVQGRRTTAPPTWPVEVPPGSHQISLQTTWVEPAYLELDDSWCTPGGEPRPANGNGGDFGAKAASEAGAVARRLADIHGRPVRVLSTREDVVRYGPKRPPLAIGVRSDGSCVVHVARTPGIVAAIRSRFATVEVVEVDVVGPPTSAAIRGAGWTEVAVALTCLQHGPRYHYADQDGAVASAEFTEGGLEIEVDGGAALDATVMRSYVTGAAHMAMGMVWSESVSVGEDGQPHDLTIRSFGILRAVDLPVLTVQIVESERPPCPVSNAVFVAVAAAAWAQTGHAPRWPTPRLASPVRRPLA